jgi:hypothetical protein
MKSRFALTAAAIAALSAWTLAWNTEVIRIGTDKRFEGAILTTW